MQNKYFIKKFITVIVAILIVSIACVFMFNKKSAQDQNVGNNTNTSPEVDNNVAFLIEKYALPYRQLYIDGENLIDGIYGNRTFYAILLEAESVSSPKYYIGDKRISFNNKLFKTEDGFVLFSICDNIELKNLKLVISIDGQDKTFEVDNLKKKAAEDLINVQKIDDDKYAFAMPTDKSNNDSINYIYDIVYFGKAWDINNPVEINIDPTNIGVDYQYKITTLSDVDKPSNSKQVSVEYVMNTSKTNDELKKIIKQQLVNNKIIFN